MPKGNTHFHVWLAADAFLYLPIYALKHFRILEKVGAANNWDVSIEIETPDRDGGLPGAESGDDGAARRMLYESEQNRSAVHLSVGDPLQALKPPSEDMDAGSLPSAFDNLRVIASLIKKPPFWLVGNTTLAEISQDGDLFAFYKEHLGTGHELGLRIARKYDLADHLFSSPNDRFGKELDVLFRGAAPTTSNVILTADIMGVARSVADLEKARKRNLHPPIPIEDELDFRHFLTTGVCVHKWQLTNKRQELMIFLKALSIASGMFATSAEAISVLARELSRDRRFKDQFILDDDDETFENSRSPTSIKPRLTQKPSDWLANSIIARETYSPNLDFTYDDWRASVEAISDNGIERFRARRGGNHRFMRLKYLSNVDQSLARMVCRTPDLNIPSIWQDRFSRWRDLILMVIFVAIGIAIVGAGADARPIAIVALWVAMASTCVLMVRIFEKIRFFTVMKIAKSYTWRNAAIIGGILLITLLITLNGINVIFDDTLDWWGKFRNISLTVLSSFGVIYGSYVAQFLPRYKDD